MIERGTAVTQIGKGVLIVTLKGTGVNTDTTRYVVGVLIETRSVTGLEALTGDPGEVGAGAEMGEGDVAGAGREEDETIGLSIRTLI